MRDISRSELEDILLTHRYWSGDDMTDPACDCGAWPGTYKRNGEPTETWVEHVLAEADENYPAPDGEE